MKSNPTNSQDFTGLVVIIVIIVVVAVITTALVFRSRKSKNRKNSNNFSSPNNNKYCETCKSFSLFNRLLNKKEGFATWQCQKCGSIIDVPLTLEAN